MSPETEQQSDVIEAAMSLIKLASDPVATEARLKALSKAIEDSNAAAERSKAAEAAADAAEKRANAVLSEIAARETNFQSWHDQTTAALRSHEEATHAARAAAADWHQSLANRESCDRSGQGMVSQKRTYSATIRRNFRPVRGHGSREGIYISGGYETAVGRAGSQRDHAGDGTTNVARWSRRPRYCEAHESRNVFGQDCRRLREDREQNVYAGPCLVPPGRPRARGPARPRQRGAVGDNVVCRALELLSRGNSSVRSLDNPNGQLNYGYNPAQIAR
jgi:hypothetical protein